MNEIPLIFPNVTDSYPLTPMLLMANFANKKLGKKVEKRLKNLANGYSSESTQGELSNEYQHDSV